MSKRTIRNLLAGILVLAMGVLILGIVLVAQDMLAEPEAVAEITTAVTPTQPTQPLPSPTTEVLVEAPLPPPILQELPTATPLPTLPPTDTPQPTETPLPTATAVPPTAVPQVFAPTAVPPTAVPPTNTPAPTGPQPTNANGIEGRAFALQDWRTSLTPGGQIWYEWTVANTSGAGVPYSTIGVMPRRNGQDIVAWYQNNWGANNDVLPPEGLSWPSWMAIPEAGDYTLRLVVCFDGYQTCLSGGGTFYTLSQEIPVSIR